MVGLCAVLIAIAAYYDPQAFGIFEDGKIKLASLIEMSIGSSIGAITFSGSCIAFLKLQESCLALNCFRGQHLINLLIGIGIIIAIVLFAMDQSENIFGL